jgi:hypothetical protein
MIDFQPFRKIPRLQREIIVTEKIDGTNAQICITEDGQFFTGSRTRWITPEDDNFGFSKWAHEHKEELMQLGVGSHYGEWWGQGIQRNYGMKEKHFSLFNVSRWETPQSRPACCDCVPVLYQGPFDSSKINAQINNLKLCGSIAAPGFMKPEGIVVYHTAGNLYFKQTIDKDEEPKSMNKEGK